MINTVIYDMDGLLLDTEPLWGTCMLQAAEKYSIPITANRFKETTGLRIYEVLDYWALHFPWEGPSPHAIAQEIVHDIIAQSKAHASVMEGVVDSLEMLQNNGFKLGMASSSPAIMIDALLQYFDLTKYFNVITSADVVALGKPHPAVFLHCANELNAKPNECVVLEDSINGIIAGKAARMKVITIPDKAHRDHPQFTIANAMLHSLKELNLELIAQL